MLARTDEQGLIRAGRPAPHAVVIGSGFGGLAASIRLATRGWRVTVLERLDQPGGRARVFSQDGFTFDAGPTVVTAPFLFEELWRLCGRRLADDVTLRPVSPFYRVRFHDGETFDYTGDPAAMRAEIARLAPDDVAGYDRFMRESEAIYRVGFERLGDAAFDSLADMARAAPALLRHGAWRSVYALVARYVRDERVRTVLSFHPLLIGGNPFRASAVYGLIAHLERAHGVHYAMGGTGRLVAGLVSLLQGQGGRLRLNAEVARIIVEDGTARGVELATGEVLRSDIVVSNADSVATYRSLVPASARRRWTDRRLARARLSMGLFVWYFGTRGTWPEQPHHAILLGPRYRALLHDIFIRKRLAQDFSLYLHRPTASDPAMAPPGCDAFYVLAPVPNLASGIDWTLVRENYRAAIEKFLDRHVLPGLSGRIVTSRMLTPADFASDYLAWQGSGFSLEPVLSQSAYFRPHNRSEDVRHLYLVGAGTHPGAGLPGVLCSARALDRVVPDVAAFV